MKKIEQTYGYDDVAIVPGEITLNPELVETKTKIGDLELAVPVLASAMDSVVDPNFAKQLSNLGGAGVINLDGIHVRYEDTEEIYKEIISTPQKEVTELLQKVYSAPMKENLIGEVVKKIKESGEKCFASFVPASTKKFAPIAVEAGCDAVVVQSTVTTARHNSKSLEGLILSKLVDSLNVPIIVGNTVTYNVTRELMEQGVHGILVGVGPGSACTSREVLGVGVPQISATLECSSARDDYFKLTGRYVSIITDGGIRTGGELCKSFVAGADTVMIGSPFSKTFESPASGNHWGMATPHGSLPRGTRIVNKQEYSIEELLFGPSSKTDGTRNLVGALRVCMGMIGAEDIISMHDATLIYAPTIKTEGKSYQLSGLGS
ncbi:MAG: GuaB3 family IMP dehydrogenase-related protein [Chloroflexi bacterium]|nr:GuaB3 family IMP dehydrogenase-related protein [Chloroflexota bacterium]